MLTVYRQVAKTKMLTGVVYKDCEGACGNQLLADVSQQQ